MAAASSGRAEIDTSRAFRSVKEAVAVFDERFLAAETRFRLNPGARRLVGGGERSSRPELEGGDHGVRSSGFLIRESLYSKLNSIANAKHEGSSSKPPEPLAMARPVSDAVPMYLVPSSPPFFASSPSLASLAHDDDDDDDEGRKGAADLMVMSSIKKVEEEAARARQEVAQLKQRLSEMELSMATLNAKLHRALSKVAHMEADMAAAERAGLRRRDVGDMAVAVWAERRAPRQPLGHLLGLGGEADGEVADGQRAVIATARRRKTPKQKPIVPLVVPLINDMLFSKKKRRMKIKESVYMKELYSLLRLS